MWWVGWKCHCLSGGLHPNNNNQATLWPNLHAQDTQDFNSSWNCKLGPSVAIRTRNSSNHPVLFPWLHIWYCRILRMWWRGYLMRLWQQKPRQGSPSLRGMKDSVWILSRWGFFFSWIIFIHCFSARLFQKKSSLNLSFNLNQMVRMVASKMVSGQEWSSSWGLRRQTWRSLICR